MNRRRILISLVIAGTVGFLLPGAIPIAQAQPATSLSGVISYGGTDPTTGTSFQTYVREALVYAIDARRSPVGCVTYVDGACTLAPPTYTDSSGRYSFSNLPTTDSQGHVRNIEARVYANGLAAVGSPAARWVVAPSYPSTGYFRNSHAQTAGSNLVEDIRITGTSLTAMAFAVFDEARLSADYVSQTSLSFAGQILLTFPALATNTTDSTHINVSPSDAYLPDNINHDIGHALAEADGFFGPVAASHSLGVDNIPTQGEVKGLQIAWNEGFADFFAVQARVHVAVLPSWMNRTPSYALDVGHSFPMTGTTPPAQGEGDELAVARILWSFAQGNVALFNSLSFSQMVALLSSNSVTTLSAAVSAFRTLGNFDNNCPANPVEIGNTVSNANSFGVQLADQAVGPRVISPLPGTTLDPEHPPAFTWFAGGTNDSSAPLNSFDVCFYNNQKQWIPGTVETVSTADSNGDGRLSGTTFTWTPKSSDSGWFNLVSYAEANPKLTQGIYLFVEGSGNDTVHQTNTGPYVGQWQRVGNLKVLPQIGTVTIRSILQHK